MTLDATSLTIPLITILGSILLSILGSFLYLRQAKIDLKKEYEKRFNEKKWNTYTEFTDNVLKIIRVESEKPDQSVYRPNIDLQSFMAQLLLVGSDAVVTSYRTWRMLAHVNGQRDPDAMGALFNVVVEMRKDLGNQTTKVNLDDLLGMIVPNYKRSL